MAGGDPMGDQLPNEVEVASFHRGELRLTSHRVRYKGRGLRRHESFEMQLASITGAGVVRRYTVHLAILIYPAVLILLGFLGLIVTGQEDPFVIAFFLALVTTPVLVVGSWLVAPRHAVRVVGGGHAWHVTVARRRLEEARGFVREVMVAIASPHEGASPRVEMPTLTARPFGR